VVKNRILLYTICRDFATKTSRKAKNYFLRPLWGSKSWQSGFDILTFFAHRSAYRRDTMRHAVAIVSTFATPLSSNRISKNPQ
jgi:hypothetical protein